MKPATSTDIVAWAYGLHPSKGAHRGPHNLASDWQSAQGVCVQPAVWSSTVFKKAFLSSPSTHTHTKQTKYFELRAVSLRADFAFKYAGVPFTYAEASASPVTDSLIIGMAAAGNRSTPAIPSPVRRSGWRSLCRAESVRHRSLLERDWTVLVCKCTLGNVVFACSPADLHHSGGWYN